MILTYTFSNIGKGNNLKTRQEAIESCDRGAQGMQELLVITSTFSSKGKSLLTRAVVRVVIWIVSRVYTRTVTDEHIEYNFWLLGWFLKKGEEHEAALARKKL